MTSTVSDRHPISPRTTFRRGPNYIAGLIGIGLTYFVLAKSGLALALIHPSASPIWLRGPFEAVGVDRLIVPNGYVAENLILSDHPIFADFARHVGDLRGA